MSGGQKNEASAPNGPDFSTIDSEAKAQELFRRGDLEKLFLLPLEFGGQEVPENVSYVPIGVAATKRGIDMNIISPLVEDGKVTQYSATPEYQDNSFIPIAIRIVASKPGEFVTTINIWGKSLRRD